MMSLIRVRKNLLGSSQPQSINKQIRDLLNPEYYNKINLRPRYQRGIKWTLDAMCDFIGTVMNNGLVPGVIMYQLHPGDNPEYEGKYDDEVVDGKHRIFALYAFKSSSLQKLPNKKKKFIVHWRYETQDENGNTHVQRVFYQDTLEVQNWYRETYKDGGAPSFLTPEEKKAYDSFTINVTNIPSKLSMEQRSQIFLDLQKGTPVRNSDYLKNMLSCKLIAEFDENCYEEKMSVFLDYCTNKGTNYWVQWATRLFLLYRESLKQGSSDPAEVFIKKDTPIKEAILSNHADLHKTITPEEFDKFDEKINDFIGFLQNQEEGIEFNRTQMNALFYHFCCKDVDVDIISTHMQLFSKDGKKRENQTLWESSPPEQRKSYFNSCLTLLEDMTYHARPIDNRTPTKKLRKQVFDKAILSGACDICGTKITIDKFEVSHIVARARGGPLELDNLIPLCMCCNREMGTLNPDDYKKKRLYNKF